jgi:hypothetical protein
VLAPYLVFSSWITGWVVLLATLVTIGVAFARWREPAERWRRLSTPLSLALMASAGLRLVTATSEPVIADFRSAIQLGSLARQTAAALRHRAEASPGREERYLVTWIDALYGGGQGIGLVNELARHGFSAGVTAPNDILFSKHWILEEADATARVHFVNAAWVQDTKRVPGAVMIARVDRRTPEEQEEYLHSQSLLAAALRRKGRDDVAERLPFDLRTGGDLLGHSQMARAAYRRMMDLGVPAAVFLLPVNGRSVDDSRSPR